MQQRKKIPRDDGAFTLIEVALAATVLLFAIVSAFQIIAAGTRMLDFSRKQTLATQIIRAEIDQSHLCTWTMVKGWADSGSKDDVTISLNSVTTTYTDAYSRFGYPELMTFTTAISGETATTGFTVRRETSYLSGRTDMVQITFTVTWKAKVFSEKTGTSHTYSRKGTTYVGKNGLSTTYRR